MICTILDKNWANAELQLERLNSVSRIIYKPITVQEIEQLWRDYVKSKSKKAA